VTIGPDSLSPGQRRAVQAKLIMDSLKASGISLEDLLAASLAMREGGSLPGRASFHDYLAKVRPATRAGSMHVYASYVERPPPFRARRRTALAAARVGSGAAATRAPAGDKKLTQVIALKSRPPEPRPFVSIKAAERGPCRNTSNSSPQSRRPAPLAGPACRSKPRHNRRRQERLAGRRSSGRLSRPVRKPTLTRQLYHEHGLGVHRCVHW
jgi:hypothetical protein